MKSACLLACLALLAGCSTLDEIERYRRGDFDRISSDEFQFIATSSKKESGLVEGYTNMHMEIIEKDLRSRAMCPNGFEILEITDRQIGVKILAQPVIVTYRGRCK